MSRYYSEADLIEDELRDAMAPIAGATASAVAVDDNWIRVRVWIGGVCVASDLLPHNIGGTFDHIAKFLDRHQVTLLLSMREAMPQDL